MFHADNKDVSVSCYGALATHTLIIIINGMNSNVSILDFKNQLSPTMLTYYSNLPEAAMHL